MISEAKEEGTYEEMKEEIEADIKRAKYLQTISIRKNSNYLRTYQLHPQLSQQTKYYLQT